MLGARQGEGPILSGGKRLAPSNLVVSLTIGCQPQVGCLRMQCPRVHLGSLGGIGIRFNLIAKVLAVQLCWKEDMSQPTEGRRSEDAPMNLEHIIH